MEGVGVLGRDLVVERQVVWVQRFGFGCCVRLNRKRLLVWQDVRHQGYGFCSVTHFVAILAMIQAYLFFMLDNS